MKRTVNYKLVSAIKNRKHCKALSNAVLKRLHKDYPDFEHTRLKYKTGDRVPYQTFMKLLKDYRISRAEITPFLDPNPIGYQGERVHFKPLYTPAKSHGENEARYFNIH